MNNKETILNILKTALAINKSREGASDLIYYLENGTDYFTAPASTIYHGNYEGGLSEHSLNVYNLLKEKVSRFNLNIGEDTIAICGLLHDACKLNTYIKSKKWDKDFKNKTGEWRQIDCYEIDDKFPASHGSKSVFTLQRFIKLTDEEILAIQWHMGTSSASVLFPYPDGYSYNSAKEMYPLVTLLFTADLEASGIMENKNK